jgi:hypothetical protein
MSIPLDRLYHYVETVAQDIYNDHVIIYRFWPHGSKNLKNLSLLKYYSWQERTIFPRIYCQDQEPLDYDFYHIKINLHPWVEILKSINRYTPKGNLNYFNQSLFKKSILLHSEKQSYHVEKYQQDGELIPVYYWSHAVIARDWFRYAKHVKQNKQANRTFLIYNRAWSGTREYRLRFLELLVKLELQHNCLTSVNAIEPELNIHYNSHEFKNPAWKPQTVLENFFPTSTAQSHYSADFDIEDYEATDIEVVLETLFDDTRLHLTEKILRSIACGQTFILAGTYGSLEYLRSYGFVTFDDIWDESYDLVKDPEERLMRIADLMKQIANWTHTVRERKMAEARAIADYNKQHFFSQEFFNLVVNELRTNLKLSLKEFEVYNNSKAWIAWQQELITHPEITEFLKTSKDTAAPTQEQLDFIMSLAHT